jgi:hypothetical protein
VKGEIMGKRMKNGKNNVIDDVHAGQSSVCNILRYTAD